MTWLLLALGSKFVQQTFIALGKVLPVIIAPAVFLDLQIDPALLGVYVSLTSAVALVVQTGCGSFILRYGALRLSQFALVSLSAGIAMAAHGSLIMFRLSAIIASGAALSTPASSHLLDRYSCAKYMPLVFSIKQTAVPSGMLLAGLLGPFFTEWIGWREPCCLLPGPARCSL